MPRQKKLIESICRFRIEGRRCFNDGRTDRSLIWLKDRDHLQVATVAYGYASCKGGAFLRVEVTHCKGSSRNNPNNSKLSIARNFRVPEGVVKFQDIRKKPVRVVWS